MNKETYFKEELNHDESQLAALRKSNKLFKIGTFSGWATAFLTLWAAIPLLKMHEIIPLPISVDRQSGLYEVHVGNHRINPSDPANETRMVADLTSYVAARTGFARAEAEANYKRVWWMTDDSQREAWDQEYKPDLNKNALLNVMLPHDTLEDKNFSVSFLPINPMTPQIRVAQVQYDRIKTLTGKTPRIQRFVTTISYTYKDDNIPTKTDDVRYNAFGFAELTMRTDKVTEEHDLADDAKAVDGQYRAVPVTNAQTQGAK